MFSKLQAWLVSSPRPRLTDDQASEVARELNRPILEPLVDLPPGFESSRQFEPSHVAARIRRIPWLTNCGSPLIVNLSMPVLRVPDWTRATELCRTDQWDGAELEAQNQLTVWLHMNARQDYQKWNDHVFDFKKNLINPVVVPAVRAYCRQLGLDDSVLHSVCWDVLGALMESHYLYTGHQAFFFLELLELYEAGHFPCGWSGEWPKGEVYVF
jgi:hypothetical protein